MYSCFLRALPTGLAWEFIPSPPKDPCHTEQEAVRAGHLKGRWARSEGRQDTGKGAVPQYLSTKSRAGLVVASRLSSQIRPPDKSVVMRQSKIKPEYQVTRSGSEPRAQKVEDQRDWQQEPELRSSSTAKVDRTPLPTAFCHTTLCRHTSDSRSQSCMKPVVSLSLRQLNHRIRETQNISSWKEASRIFEPNSLLLAGLLKTKPNDD